MRRISRELGFLRRRPGALLPSGSWATLDDHARRLDLLTERLEHAEAAGRRQQELIGELTADVVRHQAALNDPPASRLQAVSAWIAAAAVSEESLVSIVLPTHNRPDGLLLAVASVRAQTYRNWELVVVDDGSSEDQRPALEALGDPRVRVLRLENTGLGGAVNAGLAEVRGDLVAYLEDDNLMDAGWLRAAAWAMGAFPDLEMLYGAMVWQVDTEILGAPLARGLPMLEFRPWDRALLERHSFIHIGAVVHRRGLPEAGYNTALARAHDYDFALRATRGRDPLALPALAGYYGTDRADRMSASIDVAVSVAEIQALHGLPALRPRG